MALSCRVSSCPCIAFYTCSSRLLSFLRVRFLCGGQGEVDMGFKVTACGNMCCTPPCYAWPWIGIYRGASRQQKIIPRKQLLYLTACCADRLRSASRVAGLPGLPAIYS